MARPPRSGPPSRRRPAHPGHPARRPPSADSRPTSPWAAPIRTPPASVTTSDAPTMRSPGVGSSLRPPWMSRNGPPAHRAMPASDRAASRRSSSACIGEKSRRRRKVAAAARRRSTGSSRGRVGPIGDRKECSQRGKPDEFGLGELHAVLRGDVADGLPDQPQRCRCEVEDVHRDLGAAEFLDPEAVGLDPGQAATRLTDAPRDALGQLDVARIEVDVVGDEEGPGADGDRAGRRMDPGRSEVGARGRSARSRSLSPS